MYNNLILMNSEIIKFKNDAIDNFNKEKKMSIIIITLLDMVYNDKHKLKLIYEYLEKIQLLDMDIFSNNYNDIRNEINKLLTSFKNKNNIKIIKNDINNINNKVIQLDLNYNKYNKYKTNYNELSILGKGSYGSVYKVYHSLEQNTYAIKKIFITDEIINENTNIFNEIQLFSKLYHDNIIRFYSSWIDIDINSIIEYNKEIDDDEDDEIITKICPILFIQMELCDITLKEYMSSIMLTDNIYVRINYLKQILFGVEYLHKNNIIHRDLKPDNIFIKNKIIKIGDFGLSKKLKNNNTTIQLYNFNLDSYEFNNSIYRAPELLEGNYNNTSDIYSIGIIFLELLIDCKTFFEKSIIIRDLKKIFIKIYESNEYINIPNLITNDYDKIILQMINPNYKLRPSIDKIIEILN